MNLVDEQRERASKIKRATIEMPREEYDRWNRLFQMDCVDVRAEGHDMWLTAECYTAIFDEMYEADLKIVASDDSFYIVPTLYFGSCECNALDTDFSFEEPFEFEDEGMTFIVAVVPV